MANNTINTFIKGIKADTAPIDAPNSAATDIVNGELLTDNGNQMILQPAKSNVPVTGLDTEYEVETFFVEMSNGDGIGDLLTIDVTKKLHSIYFTLGPQGRGDFLNLTFTLNYENGSTETAGPFGADMFAQSGSEVETYSGTYFLYAYDNKNFLKSVSFRTGSGAPVILNYTLYYYQENNIGLGENTKILGVKEYNDVAYIVSANRLTEFYNGSASNNVNKTAYDDMDLGSVEDDRDLPQPNNSVKIIEDSNLNVLDTYLEQLGCVVGYSDHTESIINPIAATAKGASIYEKHFTLDKSLPGPDHRMALNPQELKETIQAIRDTEKALGSNEKYVLESEKENRLKLRKSVVATIDIPVNTVITIDMLGVKRPGSGMAPNLIFSLIGKRTKKEISKDDLITPELFY